MPDLGQAREPGDWSGCFNAAIMETQMPADTPIKDGLQLLAADHRKVEDLFEQFEKASGASAKQKLVRQICTELKVHAQIEEEVYYPAIRGEVEDADLDEAYVEHDSAKLLINELEAAAPDESFYDAKVKVLSELIEHHVAEEEKLRDNLFQQTRAAEIDLIALGAQLAARKAELMAEAESGALPPAEAATLQHETI
jgi:hemerythrin superfamily protein